MRVDVKGEKNWTWAILLEMFDSTIVDFSKF